jgi:SAM-dependent methyltransferase
VSNQAPAGPTASDRYWDRVLDDWRPTTAHRLWRSHSDAVNRRLLRRWLTGGYARLLKTDLFDEAVAPGLYPELATRARRVVGVDLSHDVVAAARERHPGLDARVASVLSLPFVDASFDAVVSNSTLDHFERRVYLQRAVAELARVMSPGGELVITLDNRLNPVIALRTSRRLAALSRRLGLVPYYLGVTCGPRGLAELLRGHGFEVREMSAIMHCPPQLAGLLAQRRGRGGAWSAVRARHLTRVERWEALERSPTRYLTGHFVAALAVRV